MADDERPQYETPEARPLSDAEIDGVAGGSVCMAGDSPGAPLV